jgi:tRNA(adenine34) deaminase
MDRDIVFMKEALELARLAADMGEIPVGALVVDSNSGEVIARAHNLRENNKLATAHAEILAIEEACRKRGGWRLCGCTLYVTLEPCPMCAGAIVNSRIDRVVWGADDMVAGCCKSVINFNSYPFNHSFATASGVCEDECKAVLQEFFQTKRRSE